MTDVLVHETAIVDDGAELGPGTRVWHFVHVSRGARIGARCVLGQNVYVGNDVRIGDGVKIQNNVSIYTGVEIDDDVFLGPSCVFTNVGNPRAFVERKDEYRRTHVKKGASVGANATIVCGHDLGEYCFVGAGAVVTRDVPPYALVVGAPARRIGWMCKCGERLPDGGGVRGGAAGGPRIDDEMSVACGRCGAGYALTGGRCAPVGP